MSKESFYRVHYSIVMGYDVEVVASSKEEALELADEQFEEASFEEFEYGDHSAEVTRTCGVREFQDPWAGYLQSIINVKDCAWR